MATRKLRRHAGEHDLIAAFAQSGCPVCRLTTESVDAYLTAVCYEQVNDLDLREQLRSVGGFWRGHADLERGGGGHAWDDRRRVGRVHPKARLSLSDGSLGWWRGHAGARGGARRGPASAAGAVVVAPGGRDVAPGWGQAPLLRNQ